MVPDNKPINNLPPANVLPTELINEIKAKYKQYSDYTARWSICYWGFTFGSAVLSALAGLLLKLDAFKAGIPYISLSQTDISAILAGMATLFITISSAGDFSGKWKANRTAKNRTEQLLNDFFVANMTTKDVVELLNKIVDDQNNGVINTKDPIKQ